MTHGHAPGFEGEHRVSRPNISSRPGLAHEAQDLESSLARVIAANGGPFQGVVSPSMVLGLQRIAGNVAVSASLAGLVAQRDDGADPGSDTGTGRTDVANLRLPSDPTGLPPEWTIDPTHRDPNGSRWRHPDGEYLDFHKGRPGKPGWRGKDHWHHNGEDEHREPGDEIPEPTPVSAPPVPDKEPEDASDSPGGDQAPSGDQTQGDTNSSSSISIEDVVKVLTVLGLSLALAVGIVAALADPEPASKVALAVGDAALAGVILGMLGLSQSGQPSNPGA